MEQTTSSGQPLPSGGRMLEGVPPLHWGKSGDCTFLGALAAATAVTPYPADYHTLMGATGLAFRVRWFQGPEGQRWCPSSPVGEMKDEAEAAAKASGWTLRAEFDEKPEKPIARLAPDIKAAIDAGLPPLAYDEGMNMAVIVGYEDEGATVWMQGYTCGAEAQRRATADLAMFAFFLDEHTEPLSPYEAARQGIALGVRNETRRHEPEEDEGWGYWHGPTALRKWAEDIGRYDGLTDDERGFLFFVSWWNYDGLLDARSHAGRYLREVAPLFAPEAGAALERAADLYDQEARLLRQPFEAKDAFQGPWRGEAGGNVALWTEPVRHREQSVLACAADIEASALAELACAL